MDLMIPLEIEKKQTTMKSTSNRILYVLLATILILGLIAVGLIAYVVQNIPGKEEKETETTGKLVSLEQLSGFFLSELEVEELLNRTWKWTSVNETIEYPGNYSSTWGPAIDTDLIPIVDGSIVHACCVSRQNYYTPTNGWITDTLGVRRRLATFQNKKQYFPSEICGTIQRCTTCNCEQRETVYFAVVVDPDGAYDITKFSYNKGCCKCVIRPARSP